MVGAESNACDGGSATTTCHFALFNKGEAATGVRVKKGNTKGVLGGKDALYQLLFVHVEGGGHVLH